MIELLLDNRDGNVFDISDLIDSVSWKTKRKGSASSIEFKYINTGEFKFNSGDVLSLKVDGEKIFYGFVFSESNSSKDEMKPITAFDQIRYLMANDTYVFVNKTATQIIRQIASDFGLRIGEIEDTGYVLPSLIEDNKKLIDIICKALDQTLMTTGKTYVLYDDFGFLTLKNINNLRQDIVISDDRNLTNYDTKKSIEESFNKVKIVRDNKDAKKREVYIAQDSKNIAKWGMLQYYYKADENMNAAQIKEMAEQTLKLKNKEMKTLKIDVLGTCRNDIKLRAGHGVYTQIQDLGYNQFFLIEEATHDFSNDEHTMNFDLKVI